MSKSQSQDGNIRHRGEHHVVQEAEDLSPLDASPSTTLEAIYNINAHAKKYARLADENYRCGKKSTARANSLKKRALYKLKTKVLNQFLPYLNNIERHEINDEDFLCLYLVDEDEQLWSYHQPENRVRKSWIPDEVKIKEGGNLSNFESGEDKPHSEMSLKEALLHLKEVGYNANDYLPEKRVNYAHRSYFVGWKYL